LLSWLETFEVSSRTHARTHTHTQTLILLIS